MEDLFEKSLFRSRWLLAPMYGGLVLALLILVWTFFMELARFASHLPFITLDEAVLGTLALIDLSLAGNLLLIIIFAGYENFVSKMDLTDHVDRPEWQGSVDFSGLKLKLIASIVAISGIHLLKVFMDVDHYSSDKIFWMITIHLTFIVSGVLLALMDLLSAVSKSKGTH